MTEGILSGPPQEPAELEIVLDRRQQVIWMFLAVVALALVSAVAYFAGRGAGATKPTAVAGPAPAPAPPPVVPMIEATVVRPPDAPVFQEPVAGAVYLQMGAVEKGVAVVFVEGLRRMDLAAIAAPGPDEKIYRVLVGPAADSAALRKLKARLDEAGLSTFIRRWQAPTATAASTAPTPPA